MIYKQVFPPQLPTPVKGSTILYSLKKNIYSILETYICKYVLFYVYGDVF